MKITVKMGEPISIPVSMEIHDCYIWQVDHETFVHTIDRELTQTDTNRQQLENRIKKYAWKMIEFMFEANYKMSDMRELIEKLTENYSLSMASYYNLIINTERLYD